MDFTEVSKRRASIRKYDGRKPTERQLSRILEAGRWVSTVFNRQSQKEIGLESQEALAQMDQVHPCRYRFRLGRCS